ncbi:MAG: ABC transporter ATP-binding protein [Halofilum sp. (in: g-proteobacteria)]|nr:ABC transporter ATP-binding protein [Halofilum sp. (in: g-proteobacteria)]
MTETGENAVELRDVVKAFGDLTALHRANLTVPDGSFVTFLGPSGCGKTTSLRMIAGLLEPTEGDIFVRGKRVNDIPIHRRNLGLVFQNYALFPHKTIYDNVAFGLKYRDVPADEVRKRVRDALELVQLPQVEDRRPNQLSGGQQQRIALARAIVIRPDVLLLDEPLSALDANLREEMRVELKRIQRELGIATVFVTHDQAEALAMSDKVVVMNHGRIEQEGTPEEVYNQPNTEFVARFLGSSNILDGKVASVDGDAVRVQVNDGPEILAQADASRRPEAGATVRLAVRAERLLLAETHQQEEGTTLIDATVSTVDYQGQVVRYFLEAGPLELQAINTIDRHPFAEGAKVQARVRASDCVLLPGTAD